MRIWQIKHHKHEREASIHYKFQIFTILKSKITRFITNASNDLEIDN